MPSLEPNHARRAGLLYLVPTFVGPFALMVVPSAIVVAGDAARTTANVVRHESLFRAGLAGDAVIVLAEIALTAALFALFAKGNPLVAIGATLARATMTALQAANVAPALYALAVAHAARGSAAEEESVLRALELRASFVHVWEVPFALHLALVAMLVARDRRFPRALVLALGVAAVGYATNGLGCLLYPAGARVFEVVVGVAAIAGEVPFVLWLVVAGTPTPRARA